MTEHHDPTLINENPAPTELSRRAWAALNMTALWISMAVCVPTHMALTEIVGFWATLSLNPPGFPSYPGASAVR